MTGAETKQQTEANHRPPSRPAQPVEAITLYLDCWTDAGQRAQREMLGRISSSPLRLLEYGHLYYEPIFKAAIAQRIIATASAAIDAGSEQRAAYAAAVGAVRAETTRALLKNLDVITSSSPFQNACAAAAREVRSQILTDLDAMHEMLATT